MSMSGREGEMGDGKGGKTGKAPSPKAPTAERIGRVLSLISAVFAVASVLTVTGALILPHALGVAVVIAVLLMIIIVVLTLGLVFLAEDNVVGRLYAFVTDADRGEAVARIGEWLMSAVPVLGAATLALSVLGIVCLARSGGRRVGRISLCSVCAACAVAVICLSLLLR